MSDNSNVVKEGYLVKMGYKKNNWKKRYFVLTAPASVAYYENEKSFRNGKRPKGGFTLTPETTVVRVLGGSDNISEAAMAKAPSTPKPLDKKPNLLEINACETNESGESRTYYVSCSTPLIQDAWVTALEDAVGGGGAAGASAGKGKDSAAAMGSSSDDDDGDDDAPVNANALDNYAESEWYTLHVIASEGSVDEMAAEFATGKNIHMRNATGGTTLHQAAGYGNIPVVEFLLSHGAEVDAVNNIGKTALYLAAQQNKAEAVRALLSHGANKEIASTEGMLPLEATSDDEIRRMLQ